jgi:hypothetical protein
VVYGANHRAGQLGETGPPRPCVSSTYHVAALLGMTQLVKRAPLLNKKKTTTSTCHPQGINEENIHC